MEEIINYYLEVKSVIKTYKKFNSSRFLLIKLLKKNNLPIYINEKQAKRYTYNKNYFKEINTPNKAYFFGFLYADGYNNEDKKYIEISLAEQDIEILERFKKDIEFTGNITYIRKQKGWQTQRRLKLYGQASIDCSNLGMHKNKTYKIDFPNISSNLIHHFIRGFFDGDGCICKDKRNIYFCSFTSQKNMLESINKYFLIAFPNYYQKIIFNKRKKEVNDNVFTSVFSGNLSAMDLFCYMYKDANGLFLNRKFQKFKELLKIVKNSNYNIGHQIHKKEERDRKVIKMEQIIKENENNYRKIN